MFLNQLLNGGSVDNKERVLAAIGELGGVIQNSNVIAAHIGISDELVKAALVELEKSGVISAKIRLSNQLGSRGQPLNIVNITLK